MYCDVKDCRNNTNGYCDIINYININKDGECEDIDVPKKEGYGEAE